MDGILNVYKPAGPTSHDVVGTVRRLSKQRRVGHAGTLDPAAAGVLLVCLGQATRVIEYMAEHDKEYCAEISLGQGTDTYDATGRPVGESLVPAVGQAEVESALASFIGDILQRPPAYSALKKDGQPLYKLARAGVPVEPPERIVHIYSIDLLDWEPPRLTIKVRCSKGTYIRSIAHDLGQRLGCGGHLSGLVRLASGRFRLEDAVTLPELGAAFADGYADTVLFPMDEALLELPAVVLGPPAITDLRQGKRWHGPTPPAGGQACRAYTRDGELAALLENDDGSLVWHPRKVFGLGT
ncbi:MAG: tRNA pseudouridine(55) synthase TruB [Chloroflexota bacterium]